MEQTTATGIGIMGYLIENWPIVGAALTAIGGTLMWAKRKVINDVYVSKEEFTDRCDRIEQNSRRGHDRLSTQITHNHDEIKTLIIEQLSNKKDA